MFFSRTFQFWRRPALDCAKVELIFDLSRLMSRAYHATPTGIDRVEMAYARELLDQVPDQLCFGAVHPAGGYYGRLDTGAVRQFLAHVYALWQNRHTVTPIEVRRSAVRHLLALRPRPIPPRGGPRIYLQVSPHHLEQPDMVSAIIKAEDAKFVVMVHDVIPITHPEYARPDEMQKHLMRMRTIGTFADGVIANSQSTLDAVQPYLGGRPNRPVYVAHLGWSQDVSRVGVDLPTRDRPYFVCVGTIEPRKNHLMLLKVWRRLAETLGDDAPQLVLIGRRGWENENVIDMLERCNVLHGIVLEESNTADSQLWDRIRGAQALVLPSFAEGFGMPIMEALAVGTPVICSNIPALREAGGDIPEYLDPIDGLGWLEAITHYTHDESPRRQAQLARMKDWHPPSWRDHVEGAVSMARQICEA